MEGVAPAVTATRTDAVVTVIDTYDDEREAMERLHEYARNLRRLRKVGRYGVFMEKRRGCYYLCLADRGDQ